MDTSSPLSIACIVCCNLKFTDTRPETLSSFFTFKTNYHNDVEAVHREAAKGCSLCRIFSAGIKSADAQPYRGPLRTVCSLDVVMKWNYKDSGGKGVKVHREGASLSLKSSRAEVTVRVTKILGLEEMLPSQPDPDHDSHTGSHLALAHAKGWLDECIRSHPGCRPATESPLPSRVIDVGISDEPRLIETNGAQGTYITLSHCWGTNPILTSTMATMAERLEAIHMESLPQTFRDAVLAARALNIRYLWIDALCIIQDSWEDWCREAAVMGTYYENALLTLAAADAPDARAGCFRPRDPLTIRPSIISMRLPERRKDYQKIPPGQEMAYKDTRANTYYDWPAEECLVEVTPELSWAFKQRTRPIDTRAWTLQEQLLAPRILYFEHGRLSFTCRSAKADENSPALRPVPPTQWTKNLYAHPGLSIKPDPSLSADYLDEWYKIVEQYTRRNITKTEDVLPAISGLAARFQPWIGSEYVAGLWRSDINRGLLWTAKTHESARQQTFRPPSWSWAARNLNSIEYKDFGERLSGEKKLHATDQCLQVESVSVRNPFQDDVANANPYGEVDGGTLVGRGHFRLLTCSTKSVFKLQGQPVHKHTKGHLHDPQTTEEVGDVLLDETRVDTDGKMDVWCVPVLQSATQTYSICLALWQQQDGTFQRIGVAEIADTRWNQRSFAQSDVREFCIH